MKKIFVGFLVLMILLSSFCGCNNQNNQDNSPNNKEANQTNKDNDKSSNEEKTNEGPKVTKAGEYPITTEPVTLTIYMPKSEFVEDYETNEMTKYLEEQTGVHLDFQLVPTNDLDQKLNLLLASNTDLPDVFSQCDFSASELAKYGKLGIFLPLNSYIDEYGFEINNILEDEVYKNVLNQVAADDGNIYSLFKIQECYNCYYAQAFWVNGLFMDELGLEIPETIDELYEVLKAFKEKDANGNGDNDDEIPLIASTNGWHQNIEGYIMNAFTYTPSDADRLYLDNGVVKAAYMQDGWKEGLIFLNKLCEEGILDPVSFTQDQNQLRTLTESTDFPIVGAVPSGSPNQFSSTSGTRRQDYRHVPPVLGPSNERVVPFNPPFPQLGSYVITSECEYPEIAFRWGDFGYNDIVTEWDRYGMKGVDWEEPKEGDVSIAGERIPARRIQIRGHNTHTNTCWNQGLGTMYQKEELNNGCHVLDTSKYSIEKHLFDMTDDYVPFGGSIDRVLPPLFVNDDDVKEYNDIKTLVNDYYKEMIARFVTGDLDIDSYYDQYIDELESMGVDRYLEIVQSAYDKTFN